SQRRHSTMSTSPSRYSLLADDVHESIARNTLSMTDGILLDRSRPASRCDGSAPKVVLGSLDLFALHFMEAPTQLGLAHEFLSTGGDLHSGMNRDTMAILPPLVAAADQRECGGASRRNIGHYEPSSSVYTGPPQHDGDVEGFHRFPGGFR